MTKVHENNDNDISVIDLEIFENTNDQNISVLSVENINPKPTIPQVVIDPQNLTINQNTTISNNEQAEGHKLEKEQSKIEAKETPSGDKNVRDHNNPDNHQGVETNEEESQVPETLQLEKEQHEWRMNVRDQLFTNILSNGMVELDWKKHFFYMIATIVICGIAPFPLTLIPAHDVIRYPGYWYEFPLQVLIWTIWIGMLYPYIACLLYTSDAADE